MEIKSLVCFVVFLGFFHQVWGKEVVQSENGVDLREYQLFNKRTQLCCLGVVKTVEKGHRLRCCGTELFDVSNEICCKNTVHPLKTNHKCCGNDTYDSNSSICCFGKSHSLSPEIYTCCGVEAINPATHLCCRRKGKKGIIARKLFADADSCCGDVGYKKGKEICCGSGNKSVHDVKELSRPTCCGNDVYDKKNKQQGCCAGKFVYDVSKEICCVDKSQNTPVVKVFERENKQQRCCRLVLYSPKTSICCNGVVVDKPGKGQGICCIKK